LDAADEVELIDISPEALRQRMKQGNIYPPDQVEAALNHFFREGNLTALRELALRRTAKKTEAQLEQYMTEHGIKATWPASSQSLGRSHSWFHHQPFAATRYQHRYSSGVTPPGHGWQVGTHTTCSFSFFSQPLAKDMGPLFICGLAAEMNYLVTNMNVRIPCNVDSTNTCSCFITGELTSQQFIQHFLNRDRFAGMDRYNGRRSNNGCGLLQESAEVMFTNSYP
jgi:hypothetical protein